MAGRQDHASHRLNALHVSAGAAKPVRAMTWAATVTRTPVLNVYVLINDSILVASSTVSKC
jgi:hypothetical protein